MYVRDTENTNKECEKKMHVTCNIFLKYTEPKCVSEMKKQVKFKAKKKRTKLLCNL